jgi:uncharacterized membrane protein YeaQ/YmgE (transglycosylase-associated protein family)
METGSIFTAILAGVIFGILGRLIIPGRQAIGWILTFTLGVVGAFLGGFLAEGFDLEKWWQIFIVQLATAAVLVLLTSALMRARSKNRTSSSR